MFSFYSHPYFVSGQSLWSDFYRFIELWLQNPDFYLCHKHPMLGLPLKKLGYTQARLRTRKTGNTCSSAAPIYIKFGFNTLQAKNTGIYKPSMQSTIPILMKKLGCL
jgi:hypothetical protein